MEKLPGRKGGEGQEVEEFGRGRSQGDDRGRKTKPRNEGSQGPSRADQPRSGVGFVFVGLSQWIDEKERGSESTGGRKIMENRSFFFPRWSLVVNLGHSTP